MDPSNPFPGLVLGNLFDTVLPDLVLAFAFFTAIIYAVLGRRFGAQRPAVVMSAALGASLSVGLVWWEYANDFSIRNLGPIAVGFAILILGGVIYQSVRGAGGGWAGAGIALGASLLVASSLGLDWPAAREAIRSLIALALVFGVIAFLVHRRGQFRPLRFSKIRSQPQRAEARHDWSDLRRDRLVGKQIEGKLKDLNRQAHHLTDRPEQTEDVMLQLRRMLPAEGWLTERMARLREKSHFVKEGHVARIKEISQQIGRLSSHARLKAARELTTRYSELHLDRRLERLDKAVAENELRIHRLTEEAQKDLAAGNHAALVRTLEAASKLQRHNARIFKIIDRTEARLSTISGQAARQAGGEDA